MRWHCPQRTSLYYTDNVLIPRTLESETHITQNRPPEEMQIDLLIYLLIVVVSRCFHVDFCDRELKLLLLTPVVAHIRGPIGHATKLILAEHSILVISHLANTLIAIGCAHRS